MPGWLYKARVKRTWTGKYKVQFWISGGWVNMPTRFATREEAEETVKAARQ